MPRGFGQTKGALSPPGHQPRPAVYLQWPLDGCSAVYVREVVAVIHFPMDRPLPHGSCHYVLARAGRNRNSHKLCPNWFALHYWNHRARVALVLEAPSSSWRALASAPTSGAHRSCSDTLIAAFLAREPNFLSPISLCVLTRAVICPAGVRFGGKGLTLGAASSMHEAVPTS